MNMTACVVNSNSLLKNNIFVTTTEEFILRKEAIRKPYDVSVAEYCDQFQCNDADLDDFFANVALHYDTELLGKTYAWISLSNPRHILGMITLANDSVKLKLISKSKKLADS